MAAFGSGTPACYSDRLSARSGERIALHASTPDGPCRIEIARIGAARETVLVLENVAVGDHPTPPHADRLGCGWPSAIEIKIGADWRSGYYDILLTDAAGATCHHMLCVKPPRRKGGAAVALVLTTNTLHAYNYWAAPAPIATWKL